MRTVVIEIREKNQSRTEVIHIVLAIASQSTIKMAVPKKANRGNKKPSTKQIFVVVVALCVALVIYSAVLSDSHTYLLGLPDAPSVSNGPAFVQKERQARAEQEQFCRDLKAGRIAAPRSKQGISEPMQTKQTRVVSNDETHHIVLEVYTENDIVSDEIRDNGGWETKIVNEIILIFVKYAEEYNLSLSDLTFVDIGANVGWFTMIMAAVGVNVIAFEPMEQNLYLIRKTLCNPENSYFSDRVLVFATGLSNETQTCIVFSGKSNVGDGITSCVEDTSTIVSPWKDYEVRGKIPLDRIDNIVSATGRNIVAVKMDTEGSEAHAVLGGPTFFLRPHIPYIFSEFNLMLMAARGGDGERFMRDFLDAGYLVRDQNGKQFWTREYATNMSNFAEAYDVVFEYNP
jgi:FkbM family methyltransferase